MDARPGAQAPAASPRGTSWLWDPTLDERPDPWPGERARGTALAPGAAWHGGRWRPLGGPLSLLGAVTVGPRTLSWARLVCPAAEAVSAHSRCPADQSEWPGSREAEDLDVSGNQGKSAGS